MSALFEVVKPVCVELSKSHTTSNVLRLIKTLEKCSDGDIQELQIYLLFPLQVILKKPNDLSETLLCTINDAVKCILQRSSVIIYNMFIDFLSIYSTVLNPPPQMTIIKVSEEGKLSCVNVITTLLKRADESVLKRFYSSSNLPLIGHIVSIVIGFAQNEQLRSLRLASVDCLVELTSCQRKGGASFMSDVGNIVATFIPGISMALMQVILCDKKPGQSLIVSALDAWSTIIVFVLNDSLLQKNHQELITTTNDEQEKWKNLYIQRNKTWASSTAEKLQIIIKRIASFLIGHSQWKVRLAAIKWSEHLLKNSRQLLNKSVPKLLELLVSFIGDKYQTIRTAGMNSLRNFEKKDSNSSQMLTNILEDNLLALLTSLPRIVRTVEDKSILSSVQLFTGYLQLLGKNINTLLENQSHMDKLGLAFLQSLELDTSSLVVLLSSQASSSEVFSGDVYTTYVKQEKLFKYFKDEAISKEFVTSCRLLGFYGDPDILLDYFIAQVHGSSLYKKQAILVVNEMVLGFGGFYPYEDENKNDFLNEFISKFPSGVVSEYLASSLWDVSTTISNTGEINEDKLKMQDMHNISMFTSDKSPLLLSVQNNIFQSCLLIEGLGNFAKALGNAFHTHLKVVLYPLLEKLGDNLNAISSTAYFSLVDICSACKYRSINELVCENCDFLTCAISLKLRHISKNKQTPLVLKAMLQQCDVQLLPHVYHIVQDILICLDDHYGEEAESFMVVLYTLVSAIKRWYPSHQEESESSSSKSVDSIEAAADIRNFLLDYQKQHELASGELDKDSDSDGENEQGGHHNPSDEDDTECNDDIAEEKKENPTQIKLTIQVLERCIHLMSSENPQLRILVLDTVIIGCQVLCSHENELLPLVHRLWPSLLERFKDEKSHVVLKAFSTLEELCEMCGDFLNVRVRKVALSQINDFLTSQASISRRAGPGYRFTGACKLQHALLSGIGKICHKLNIKGQPCNNVLEACVPYLSVVQPPLLQKACVCTLQHLMRTEREMVWLRLMDVYHPEDMIHPHADFQEIKFAGCQDRNEYTDNVTKVLKIFNDKFNHNKE